MCLFKFADNYTDALKKAKRAESKTDAEESCNEKTSRRGRCRIQLTESEDDASTPALKLKKTVQTARKSLCLPSVPPGLCSNSVPVTGIKFTFYMILLLFSYSFQI